GNVHRVDNLGHEQARRHRAGVAAAFTALHDNRIGAPRGDLLRVPPRSDRRQHDNARILEALDQVLLRCQGERRHPDPFPDHQVDTPVDIRLVGPHVDAEWRIRELPYLSHRCGELIERHRTAAEDAQAASVRGGRGQARPGDIPHAGLDHRVANAEEFARAGVQTRVQRRGVRHGPTLVIKSHQAVGLSYRASAVIKVIASYIYDLRERYLATSRRGRLDPT